MKTFNYKIFLIALILFKLSLRSQVFINPKKVMFYKKICFKPDLNINADTTKELVVFNSFYNINSMIFSYRNAGYCIKEKFNYTNDTIKYCLINKEKILIHVIITDSTNKIIEEGNLKGIIPYAIGQELIEDKEPRFKYSLYYYLIKFDKWIYFDKKQNQLVEKRIELPDKINFDKLHKEDVKAIKKRRNKFLKKNHLNKDYYE